MPKPKPPITPYVNINTGTFGAIVDNSSATQATIPPETQTGRQPNLLTKPPTTGPALEILLVYS